VARRSCNSIFLTGPKRARLLRPAAGGGGQLVTLAQASAGGPEKPQTSGAEARAKPDHLEASRRPRSIAAQRALVSDELEYVK